MSVIVVLIAGAAVQPLYAQIELTFSTVTLPIGVAGAFYTFQIQTSGPTPLAWSVISGILPPGLALTNTGSLVGVPAVPGSYPFTIQIIGGSPLQTVTRTFHIGIERPLSITTPATLPFAILAAPYSIPLAASGGRPPYTWTNLGGPLPPGLSLSSDGILSGTPRGLATFTLTLRVADSFIPSNEVSRTFTLGVARMLTITTLSLPNGIQNVAYRQQLEASGGTAPLTWLLTGGRLPDGVTLSTEGLLEGTPLAPGSQSIDVIVTDAWGMASSRTFVLAIDPPVSALSVAVPAALNPRDNVEIRLSLSEPHPSPLSGELTLSFTSQAEIPSDDPMTQFSTGSRVVKFTIPPGSTSAVFSSEVRLLTGTVAGTIRLAVSLQNGPENIPVATSSVIGAIPQITNLAGIRTPAGLDVRITGYTPVRRVTNVEFTFNLKVGTETQRLTLLRNVEAEFATWYNNPASTAFGSAFSFVQSFSVQGDVSMIEAVTVRLTNAQGSTSAGPVPLQ